MYSAYIIDMRELYTRLSRDSVARGAAPAYDCHLSVYRERSYGVDRVCRVSVLFGFSRLFEAVSE